MWNRKILDEEVKRNYFSHQSKRPVKYRAYQKMEMNDCMADQALSSDLDSIAVSTVLNELTKQNNRISKKIKS